MTKPFHNLRRARTAVMLAAVAAAAGPSVAHAAERFAPGAFPASSLGSEVGDRDSLRPLLAGDGRHVVFRTQSTLLLGRPAATEEYYSDGFVRKDLVTGAVDLVATPERRRRDDGTLVSAGVADSIDGVSDDGRYVLIGSRVALCCDVQTSATPEVYVRDMTKPRSSGYELVSAVDGRSGPASYDDRTAGSEPGTAGWALSDDGRRAVFVTATASSLPGESSIVTPRWQVLVRDLDARTTRLVTRLRSDSSPHGTPVPSGRDALAPLPMLSGDGSAVAWVGSDAALQTRFLDGEDQPALDAQLLWREVDAGPAAPTRRLAGQADPDDPACPADTAFIPSQTATGPCYGPFVAPDSITPSQPTPPTLAGIGDDGRRVLFGSNAALRGMSQAAYRPGTYLADMTPGVTRKAGVTVAWSQPLSRDPLLSSVLAGNGIDGALVSRARDFDGFNPIGAFPGGVLNVDNVFAVNLTARTIERATAAPDGRDFAYAAQTTDTGVRAVGLSDDGSVIAFQALDGNLFVGDANSASDVLVVRRDTAGAGPIRDRSLPPAPSPPVVVDQPLQPLTPRYAAFGRVRVGADGVATVAVRVPHLGTLAARATGSASVRTRARGRRGASARRSVRVSVARLTRRVRTARTMVLRIPPSRPARQLVARARRGIRVELDLSFRSTGGASSSRQRYTLPTPRQQRKQQARRRAKR